MDSYYSKTERLYSGRISNKLSPHNESISQHQPDTEFISHSEEPPYTSQCPPPKGFACNISWMYCPDSTWRRLEQEGFFLYMEGRAFEWYPALEMALRAPSRPLVELLVDVEKPLSDLDKNKYKNLENYLKRLADYKKRRKQYGDWTKENCSR